MSRNKKPRNKKMKVQKKSEKEIKLAEQRVEDSKRRAFLRKNKWNLFGAKDREKFLMEFGKKYSNFNEQMAKKKKKKKPKTKPKDKYGTRMTDKSMPVSNDIVEAG